MALPAALPLLTKFALPLIGGGIGAYEGGKRGGVGGAVLGGIGGAVTPRIFRIAGTGLGANLIRSKIGASLPAGLTSTQIGGAFANLAPWVGAPAVAGAIGGGTARSIIGGPNEPPGLWYYQKPWGSMQSQLGYGADQQDLQLRGLKTLSPEIYKWMEKTKEADLRRQLAAAQIRSNIDLAARLTAQGQLGAQALGQQAMGSIGQGLTANYQYR